MSKGKKIEKLFWEKMNVSGYCLPRTDMKAGKIRGQALESFEPKIKGHEFYCKGKEHTLTISEWQNLIIL